MGPKIIPGVSGSCVVFALRFYHLILAALAGVRAQDEINKAGESPRVLATSGSH